MFKSIVLSASILLATCSVASASPAVSNGPAPDIHTVTLPVSGYEYDYDTERWYIDTERDAAGGYWTLDLDPDVKPEDTVGRTVTIVYSGWVDDATEEIVSATLNK